MRLEMINVLPYFNLALESSSLHFNVAKNAQNIYGFSPKYHFAPEDIY